MRFRTTIVLVLLLAGLGAYVYWIEVPKAQQEEKKKTLYDFKADDVTEVALVYADHEIALKKSGEEWRITKPLDVAADTTTVKNLVSAIAECEVKKTLTDASSDPAQYGLDHPLVKVTVKVKDKELPTIVVGKNTPVGFSTYIQKADDPKIMLTNAAFRSGMDKKVKDLRDKTILNFADKDVQKIELHGDGKDLTLTQKDETWTIERPASYAGDATALRSFLSTLRSMRAVDFPDPPPDPSAYGFDAPRLTLTLYLGKDNAAKSIVLGKENDKKEVYVQGSGQPPTIYTVSDWVFRDLNKNVTDFRDKTLLAFDRDKISALEVKRKDGGQFKLVRGDDKQWHLDGNTGKPAETAISQYLGDLHDLKGFDIAADHPADLAAFGLDQPLLSYTVSGEDKKSLGTVVIGEHQATEGKKDYYAMAEGGPTVFLIRDYLVTRLNKQGPDFIEKPTPTPGGPTPTMPVIQNGAEEPEDEPLGDIQDEPADGGEE
jgi:uncharacterized protein DUF4340